MKHVGLYDVWIYDLVVRTFTNLTSGAKVSCGSELRPVKSLALQGVAPSLPPLRLAAPPWSLRCGETGDAVGNLGGPTNWEVSSGDVTNCRYQ